MIRIHATKKVLADCFTVMIPNQKSAGRKLAKKAFEGTLGLRNSIGAAGRIAQQNNWGG